MHALLWFYHELFPVPPHIRRYPRSSFEPQPEWPKRFVGTKGLHYTIGLSGTRTTVGIPGSRLFWNDYRPYSGGGHQKTEQSTAQNGDNPSRYESAPIEEQFAKSTSELAPILDAARKHGALATLSSLLPLR